MTEVCPNSSPWLAALYDSGIVWSEQGTALQDCEVSRAWHAGVFNEPLSDLMKVLASLVDAENRILVKGFLDRVSLPSSPSPALIVNVQAESAAGHPPYTRGPGEYHSSACGNTPHACTSKKWAVAFAACALSALSLPLP